MNFQHTDRTNNYEKVLSVTFAKMVVDFRRLCPEGLTGPGNTVGKAALSREKWHSFQIGFYTQSSFSIVYIMVVIGFGWSGWRGV
jgi:hypothetical protein